MEKERGCGSFDTKAPSPWRVVIKPLGAQRGKRLAHDRAADPGRGDDRLLGRQPLAGREIAGFDLRDQRLDQPAAQIGRLLNGVEKHGIAIGHRGSDPSFELDHQRLHRAAALARW